MNAAKKTIVVIPAYNEAGSIAEVIRRTRPYADICVVNDASLDDTEKIVKTFTDVTCLSHEKNTHIPRTILDGMRHALAAGYDYIITMDAGLSHKPEELPLFLDAPDCDLVLGFRQKRENTLLYRKVLSRLANVLVNFALRPWGSSLPRAQFHDVTSGYRRYSARAASLLVSRPMAAKSFDFITEALMIVYRHGLSISEVPISYSFSNSSLNMKVLMQSVRMFMRMLLPRANPQP
jgi:dolichol-phosphate mannosyltransferase